MNATHEIIKAMQENDQGKRVRVASGHDEALKHAMSQGKPGDWASNHREEARSYTGYNYVCIESLASQVGQAEVAAYRLPNGKRKSVAHKEEGDPLDEDHPLLAILNRPNPTQSGSSFRYEQAMQIRLTGSSLIWNVRNGFGKVVERYVIPTAIAQPQAPNADHPFGYWRVSPDGMRYNAPFLLSGLIYSIGFEIDARDMQVVRLPHPMYKDDGYSPVSANAIWSDLAKGIDNSRIAAMRNGMKPSYLVSLDQGDGGSRLSDDDFEAMVARINNKYADTNNSGKIMVVEGGKGTVTKLSHSPDEMDYEKSHDQTRDDILANHRTPPIAVGLSSPTGREGLYAPLEQYIFLTVQPLLNMMADEDNEYWVWQYGKGAYVTYTAKGIQDKEREGKELDRLVRAKAITKNEVRKQSGLGPWEDERGEEIAGESSQPKQQEKAEGFMPKALSLLKNCGTGAGGFKPGNTCSGGGSGPASEAVREWAKNHFDNEEHAENFTKWFGDSKVVDEKGEPLVVYHGTNQRSAAKIGEEGFSKRNEGFVAGFFDSDPGRAEGYAVSFDQNWNEVKDGAMVPVYISMKNPKVYTTEYQFPLTKEGIEMLKREGHDGLSAGNVFVPFESNQIKSATGNAGTFDPDSSNIKKSCGANAPGGGGFLPGNTCGGGGGSSTVATKVNPKVLDWAKRQWGDEMAPNGKSRAENFAEWFGDSKVVDENGDPLVVYHGTADLFSSFDLDSKNRYDSGWLGRGVYTTTSADIAGSYSNLKLGLNQSVLPMYAKVENPYIATLKEKQRLQLISHSQGRDAGIAASIKWTNELKAKGHDGVILEYPASMVGKSQESREIVVFDPIGVKSATGNAGTFDQNSGNITKSLKLLIEPEFAPLPKEPDTKYACVMLMLDQATGKFVRKMQSQIEPADVHEKGFENEPHITVLYGLLTDDPTDIVDKVGSFGPVEVTVGSSSLFESDEHDVLKLNVAGEQLVQLHEAVSELPYVKFHAKYQPHITLAYLKKGYGKKYVDKFRQLNGAVLKFAEYTFSDSSKAKTIGSLGSLAQSRKKAFCPTGEGGGIDNSCPPNRGGHESKDGKWEPQWRDKPTAEEFINARDKMLDRDPKLKPFLSEIEPADLKNHKLFLSKDGKVGVALSPEGDIQNVFNAGGPKGSGVEAVIAAINAGGITLDCFDGELPRYYSRFGFTETNRMKFNREFAPNGWDFETFGEPDVVFMALTNKVSEKDMRDAKTREAPERSTEYTDDWDGAKERSRDVSRAASQGRQNGATD